MDTPDLAQRDVEMAMSGPALLVNRVVVMGQGAGLRISFGEIVSDETAQFRTAVFLAVSDALALRDLLNFVLKEVDRDSAKDTQSPEGGK